MSTLVELATQIVTAQASSSAMSTDYIISALTRVHSTLEQLETGVRPKALEEAVAASPRLNDALTAAPDPGLEVAPAAAPVPGQNVAPAPPSDLKDVFKENEVVCLVCGKAYRVLGTHLRRVHNLSPREYRKQYNIPSFQPLLSASNYERRKELAPVRKPAGKAALPKDAQAEIIQAAAPVPAPVKKRGRPRKIVAVLPA